jgi:hypothetical protein
MHSSKMRGNACIFTFNFKLKFLPLQISRYLSSNFRADRFSYATIQQCLDNSVLDKLMKTVECTTSGSPYNNKKLPYPIAMDMTLRQQILFYTAQQKAHTLK